MGGSVCYKAIEQYMFWGYSFNNLLYKMPLPLSRNCLTFWIESLWRRGQRLEAAIYQRRGKMGHFTMSESHHAYFSRRRCPHHVRHVHHLIRHCIIALEQKNPLEGLNVIVLALTIALPHLKGLVIAATQQMLTIIPHSAAMNPIGMTM